MDNLYTFLKSVYNNLGNTGYPIDLYNFINYTSFDSLIKDDDLCMQFISLVYEFDVKDILYINKYRARHIVATLLLGIGFARFVFRKNDVQSIVDRYFDILWFQTATIHDYGYFCHETTDTKTSIATLQDRFPLLEEYYSIYFLECLNTFSKSKDTKETIQYSYDVIKSYFEYSKTIVRDPYDNERCDHGIVGGCVAFKKYCKRYATQNVIRPSDVLTILIKISCLVTASHNIFKSSSPESDVIYREYCLDPLLSTSNTIISRQNKLLYLLSIVDTLECTKRFSRKNSQEGKSIYQRTILENVRIGVYEGCIMIDFTDLHSYITKVRKNKEMEQLLNNHIKSIKGLSTWVQCNTSYDNEYSVRIFI